MTIAEPLRSNPPQDGTPPPLETVKDTGLSPSVLEGLILKFLFYRGDMLGRDIASAMGLPWSVIGGIAEQLKRTYAIQAKSSLGMGDSSVVFSLTDAGRNLTKDHLENNTYVGPAPVPLWQYQEFVRLQRPSQGWLSKEALINAYRNMVVTDHTLSQIGPAVSSGNSLLIYGQPGNGKTYMAEAVQNIVSKPVYIPFAVECQGNIVQIFDPVYHQIVEEKREISVFNTSSTAYDNRWAKCKRPFIVTGGELTMQMLDLSFNPASRVYDAPFQLKANNGIYLIDDFGRQRVSPAEVLNRWIVPMERRIDYLSFESGGKMTVPFEAFLIFSTNLKPDQLGDEAFLRRIQYKMLVRSPDEQEFLTIFRGYCASKKLPVKEGVIERFIARFYRSHNKPFRRCQPRDLISRAIDLIHFERLPFELTDKVLEFAFESCFASEVEN